MRSTISCDKRKPICTFGSSTGGRQIRLTGTGARPLASRALHGLWGWTGEGRREIRHHLQGHPFGDAMSRAVPPKASWMPRPGYYAEEPNKLSGQTCRPRQERIGLRAVWHKHHSIGSGLAWIMGVLWRRLDPATRPRSGSSVRWPSTSPVPNMSGRAITRLGSRAYVAFLPIFQSC